MANKTTIEEQVAQLSQEQQDKIIKVGKVALIIELIVGIPWIIISLLGLWVIAKPPLGFDYDNYDSLYKGFYIWLAIGLVILIGIVAFVKIKYPYYSDAKWKYINKKRKK